MRRALRAAVIVSASCGRPAETPPRAEPSACEAPSAEAESAEELVHVEPEWGARVTSIELRGARRVPDELVRPVLGTRVGGLLDEAQLAADVRAVHALEAFDEVVAETEPTPGGVRLSFVLSERPLVARVEYRGVRPVGRHVALTSGELYDRARVRRAAQGLEDHLRHSGHLEARVVAHEWRRREQVDVCFAVEPGPRSLIAELVFPGNAGVPLAELRALIDDHDGKANRPGAPFRADLLEPDRLRILALYYDRGFLDVSVGEPRLVKSAASNRLRVEWPIDEGGVYRLSRLSFAGKLRAPEKRYRELLGLEPGQVFGRAKVAEGLERVRALHERLSHPAEVTPETELDTAQHSVSVRVRIEERSP